MTEAIDRLRELVELAKVRVWIPPYMRVKGTKTQWVDGHFKTVEKDFTTEPSPTTKQATPDAPDGAHGAPDGVLSPKGMNGVVKGMTAEFFNDLVEDARAKVKIRTTSATNGPAHMDHKPLAGSHLDVLSGLANNATEARKTLLNLATLIAQFKDQRPEQWDTFPKGQRIGFGRSIKRAANLDFMFRMAQKTILNAEPFTDEEKAQWKEIRDKTLPTEAKANFNYGKSEFATGPSRLLKIRDALDHAFDLDPHKDNKTSMVEAEALPDFDLEAAIGFDLATAKRAPKLNYIKDNGGSFGATMSGDQVESWIRVHAGDTLMLAALHEAGVFSSPTPDNDERANYLNEIEKAAQKSITIAKAKSLANKQIKQMQAEQDVADALDTLLGEGTLKEIKNKSLQYRAYNTFVALNVGLPTVIKGRDGQHSDTIKWTLTKHDYDGHWSLDDGESIYAVDHKDVPGIIGQHWINAGWPEDGEVNLHSTFDWEHALVPPTLSNKAFQLKGAPLGKDVSYKTKTKWIKERGGNYLGKMDAAEMDLWMHLWADGDQIGLYALENAAALKGENSYEHKNSLTHPGSPLSAKGKAGIIATANIIIKETPGDVGIDAKTREAFLSLIYTSTSSDARKKVMANMMVDQKSAILKRLALPRGKTAAEIHEYFDARFLHLDFNAAKGWSTLGVTAPSYPGPYVSTKHKVTKKQLDTMGVSPLAATLSDAADVLPEDSAFLQVLAPNIDALSPNETSAMLSSFSGKASEYSDTGGGGITPGLLEDAPLPVKKAYLWGLLGDSKAKHWLLGKKQTPSDSGEPEAAFPPPAGLAKVITAKADLGYYAAPSALPKVTDVPALDDGAEALDDLLGIADKATNLPEPDLSYETKAPLASLIMHSPTGGAGGSVSIDPVNHDAKLAKNFDGTHTLYIDPKGDGTYNSYTLDPDGGGVKADTYDIPAEVVQQAIDEEPEKWLAADLEPDGEFITFFFPDLPKAEPKAGNTPWVVGATPGYVDPVLVQKPTVAGKAEAFHQHGKAKHNLLAYMVDNWDSKNGTVEIAAIFDASGWMAPSYPSEGPMGDGAFYVLGSDGAIYLGSTGNKPTGLFSVEVLKGAAAGDLTTIWVDPKVPGSVFPDAPHLHVPDSPGTKAAVWVHPGDTVYYLDKSKSASVATAGVDIVHVVSKDGKTTSGYKIGNTKGSDFFEPMEGLPSDLGNLHGLFGGEADFIVTHDLLTSPNPDFVNDPEANSPGILHAVLKDAKDDAKVFDWDAGPNDMHTHHWDGLKAALTSGFKHPYTASGLDVVQSQKNSLLADWPDMVIEPDMPPAAVMWLAQNHDVPPIFAAKLVLWKAVREHPDGWAGLLSHLKGDTPEPKKAAPKKPKKKAAPKKKFKAGPSSLADFLKSDIADLEGDWNSTTKAFGPVGEEQLQSGYGALTTNTLIGGDDGNYATPYSAYFTIPTVPTEGTEAQKVKAIWPDGQAPKTNVLGSLIERASDRMGVIFGHDGKGLGDYFNEVNSAEGLNALTQVRVDAERFLHDDRVPLQQRVRLASAMVTMVNWGGAGEGDRKQTTAMVHAAAFLYRSGKYGEPRTDVVAPRTAALTAASVKKKLKSAGIWDEATKGPGAAYPAADIPTESDGSWHNFNIRVSHMSNTVANAVSHSYHKRLSVAEWVGLAQDDFLGAGIHKGTKSWNLKQPIALMYAAGEVGELALATRLSSGHASAADVSKWSVPEVRWYWATNVRPKGSFDGPLQWDDNTSTPTPEIVAAVQEHFNDNGASEFMADLPLDARVKMVTTSFKPDDFDLTTYAGQASFVTAYSEMLDSDLLSKADLTALVKAVPDVPMDSSTGPRGRLAIAQLFTALDAPVAAKIAKGAEGGDLTMYEQWAYATKHGLELKSLNMAALVDEHVKIQNLNKATGSIQQSAGPDLANMKLTFKPSSLANAGGSHSKAFWTDSETDNKWISKNFPSDPNSKMRIDVEHFANTLSRLMGTELAPVTRRETMPNGKYSYVGQLVEADHDLGIRANHKHADVLALPNATEVVSDILSEHVVDWVISNHDSHGGNIMLTPDKTRAFGIDKGQAWKFFPNDKLAIGYNGGNPEKTWYDGHYQQIINGTIPESQAKEIAAAVLKKAHLATERNDNSFRTIVTHAMDKRTDFPNGMDKQEFIDAIMARKAATFDDFYAFYSDLFSKAGYTLGAEDDFKGAKKIQLSSPKRSQEVFVSLDHDLITNEVAKTKAHGTPVFVAGTDIEDGFLRAFRVKNVGGESTGTQLVVEGHVRKSADKRLHDWISSHDIENDTKSYNTPSTPSVQMLTLPDADVAVSIVGAAKTVNYHSPDPDNLGKSPDGQYNTGHIEGISEARTSLIGRKQMIEDFLADNPDGLFVGTWASTGIMSGGNIEFHTKEQQSAYLAQADKYIADISHILDAHGKKTKTTIKSFGPYDYDAPVQPTHVSQWTNSQGDTLIVRSDGSVIRMVESDGKWSGHYVLTSHKAEDGPPEGFNSETVVETNTIPIKIVKRKNTVAAGSFDPSTGEQTLTGGTQSSSFGDEYDIEFDGGVIEYRPWDLQTYPTQKGLMRVQVSGATSQEQAKNWEKAQDLLKEMGLPLADADELDLELFYWRHQAGVVNDRKTAPVVLKSGVTSIYNAHSIGEKPGLSREEELTALRKVFAAYYGADTVATADWTPHFPQVVPNDPTVVGGHAYWVVPDAYDQKHAIAELRKAGGSSYVKDTVPSHGITGSASNALRMAKSGAYLSTEEKARTLGEIVGGASVSSDVGSGGARSTFLRKNQHKNSWASHGQINFHPRVLLRTQTYAFNGDNYGRLSTRNSSSPFHNATGVAAKYDSGGNETLVKYGLYWDDWLTVLFTSEANRQAALKFFKEQGITEKWGFPLEEIFRVGEGSSPANKAMLTKVLDRLQELEADGELELSGRVLEGAR